MENLNKENLSKFEYWLRTRVVVTCPKCGGEFRFPDTSVKFAGDEGSAHGSPFRFDRSPLNIACGTPKCGCIIFMNPRALNDRYKKFRQSK